MDSATLKMAAPTIVWLNTSAITNPNKKKEVNFGHNYKGIMFNSKIYSISPNGSASGCAMHGSRASIGPDEHRQRSNLESLFCYDKAIPEERIEKPVGLSLDQKAIGDNVRCFHCQAKGAVLCTTCAGSGLYVDSIMESQGIIVKVRCLGCGGSGNMMCTECGGRGHLGAK
ncbi:hypothetical protein L6164_009217 [Bauhinia variegata]|uniref:Uncharacterized protein n=1 Tax=Bauhinia variegata TaxID=167791 RepID=A0ACB9PPN0_BAUVA|nr:hypothetical protein L6164_009217 [Bauhinia variegata]